MKYAINNQIPSELHAASTQREIEGVVTGRREWLTACHEPGWEAAGQARVEPAEEASLWSPSRVRLLNRCY